MCQQLSSLQPFFLNLKKRKLPPTFRLMLIACLSCPQALTILYGRDTVNKTIEYELSEFEDLIALDIQGYKNVASSSNADVSLHSNALQNLQNLRYLNIEHVFLFPNPNTTSDDGPTIDEKYPTFEQLEQRRTELEQRHSKVNLQLNAEPGSPVAYDGYSHNTGHTEEQRNNITFVLSVDAKIVPYEQFKKQQHLISTFSTLSNLRSLRLYRCHLETITWDMFKDLSNLQMLSVEGNDLVEVPKLAFFTMPYLKTLVLSNNRLLHLDWESLAGLFELEHLDLSGNNLHYLSETTFAPLPALKYLDLRGNPLEVIYSNTFEVMNSTQSLFIGSNQPLNIHANAFKGLDSLHKLVINGLQVETLNGDLLRGMPKLKYLEINGKVDNIDFDAFTDSLELEVLILKNCSLRYISVDAFFALFDLKVLDLSWNQLEMLAPGVFNQLDSLNDLILSHNRFVELPNVLDGLQHVKMVRLEDNPWNCSCEMSNWRSLKWNKNKERREVDLPCTYKYDKIPCQTKVEDFYVMSATVMPRCFTPVEFEGYSILHVLNKKLKCPVKGKKYEEKMKVRPSIELGPSSSQAGNSKRPKEQPNNKISVERDSKLTRNDKSDENVDNNLLDLGQFINPVGSA